MWFTISTVVRKGLNLCIFHMFDHTCSGLKKSKFLWVFAYLVYHVPTSGWKQVQICVFMDNVLSIPAVVRKSLNFYVQMVFVHYSCVVFCMWFNIHTVVAKGLNLCICQMLDHIRSFLKSLNFYGFSHLVYHVYSGWKRSKFVYFGHV